VTVATETPSSIDKARAALEAAKQVDVDTPDHTGLTPVANLEAFSRLLKIAETHAAIAAAEALQELASCVVPVPGCRPYLRTGGTR
jgi:hypothetical protein